MNEKEILEPIRGDQGGTILGARNDARQAENPDITVPPKTDRGTIPNLKWSFADSSIRIENGGWVRETTVRELPISTAIAGVNMRLNPGGVREMHWHKQAEWSFMLKGKARITCVDPHGRAFQDDVSEGDLWYFPEGFPHSIQGLGDEGCEFLLVFNDGNFSENSTFAITDWFARTPMEVITKNFGEPESSFKNIPQKEKYIFSSKEPRPLKDDRVLGNGPVPLAFTHRMMAQKPIKTKSGSVRITDASIFPISTAITAGLVEIEPGGMRELHWHTNGDEWQYYISGKARMTVFGGHGTARTFNYQAGDVGVVPFPMGHYIENIGDTTLRFLEIFASNTFSDISLAKWMAFTPHELVRAHLNIDESILQKIPKNPTPVVP